MTSRPVEPWPASAFWDFALRVYGEEGVEAACLRLQDEGGIDVLLFLLACWLATSGRTLDDAQGHELRTAAGRWQVEVIAPLRHARRSLRRMEPTASPKGRLAGDTLAGDELAGDALAGAVRRRMAAVELEIERLAMIRLEALAAGAIPCPGLEPRQRMAVNLAAAGLRIPETLADTCRLVLMAARTSIAASTMTGE